MKNNRIKIYLIIVMFIILGSLSVDYVKNDFIQRNIESIVVIESGIDNIEDDSDNIDYMDNQRFSFSKELDFVVPQTLAESSGLSIVVGGIIADGYTLELNDVVIYTVGDLVGGRANIWFNYYLVAFPKDLLKDKNTLRITINSDKYLSSDKYPIYIGENSVVSTLYGFIAFLTNGIFMTLVAFNFIFVTINYYNTRLIGKKPAEANYIVSVSLITMSIFLLTFMKFDRLPIENKYFAMITNSMLVISLTLLIVIIGRNKFKSLSWTIAAIAGLTNLIGLVWTLVDVEQGIALHFAFFSLALVICILGAIILIIMDFIFKTPMSELDRIVQIGIGVMVSLAVLDAVQLLDDKYTHLYFFPVGIIIYSVTLLYWLIVFHQKNVDLILDDRNRYSIRAGILKEKSDRDALTGLFNRETMSQHLVNLQSKALSVLFVDIDNFKSINDTLGHKVGDEVLKRIGEIVSVYFQGQGYRYGGEELVILLKGEALKSAYTKGEHLRDRISKDPFLRQLIGKELSVSLGVASYPESTDEWSKVVEKADIAMYYAKNSGKNKSHIYNKEALSFYSSLKFLSHENKLLYTIMHASLEEMDQVDGDMKDHVTNVARYAEAMGKYMNLDMPSLLTLTTGAYIHDIGKIALSKNHLSHNIKLYPEDNQHTRLGYEILWKLIAADSEMLSIVRNHHERFDGKGYPDGLSGTSIPLFTRIVSIINTYDRLMTEDQQSPKAPEAALNKIIAQSGSYFDPVLVNKFAHMMAHPDYRDIFVTSNKH